MPKPTDLHEKDLLDRCKKYGIETNLTVRWVSGTPHHEESVLLARNLARIDWLFGGDGFNWKFGGDGDNGETLMYELDIYYELIYAERSKHEKTNNRN